MGTNIIGGINFGQHDFGYTCYMPERITIENLKIDDSKLPKDYKGSAIFSNFNPGLVDNQYEQPFPYVTTKEVFINNITVLSGKSLRLSDNLYMFKNVKLNYVNEQK